MRSRRLACAVLLVAASPAAAETGGSFRDWVVTCTPGLRCSAATYPGGDGALSSLALERGAAADAPVLLRLGLREDRLPSGEVAFRVDGANTLSLPAAAFAPGSASDVSTAHEGVRIRLLPRLREGRTVEVSAEVGGHAVSQVFPLSGIVASLRKLDDDQGRIGTPTALIDRGDKPLPDRADLPADVATAADLPPPVRALWQGGGCSDRGVDDPFGALGFSVPFGGETRLFVLACGMPGAYNAASRLYRYVQGDRDADGVPLPGMSSAGPTADMNLWNADLSGDRLWSFFKGRGIGDCGQTATWRLDAQAGTLVLLEAREKPDCDGQGGDPDGWPLVWPKR